MLINKFNRPSTKRYDSINYLQLRLHISNNRLNMAFQDMGRFVNTYVVYSLVINQNICDSKNKL